MANILQTVTDKFNLFNDGRKLSANHRNYILSAVKEMISSPRTQELLRLGEAYGYYGHQNRKRANKLDLSETEVINVNGKPVVVENVPACRTTDITVDESGVVTHTQEVLDTPTGRLVDDLIKSSAGGWSWATGGRDTAEASITRSYHGMDYVLQPNYISLNHPAMMLESIGERDDMILESFMHSGLDEDSAKHALNYIKVSSTQDALVDLEHEAMILESKLREQQTIIDELTQKVESHQQKDQMLLEALDSLPIFVTEDQRRAILSMATEDEKNVVTAMFESVGNGKMTTLPLRNQSIHSEYVKNVSRGDRADNIDFRAPYTRKFQ
ncbi:hypothetical protein ACN08P_23500 (plasmid) [Photobacterium leiognathi subsp. mandapamensis]|uniref:hypothetical protein n=1 Tax=Photobacterium leiognathi TaxID=553611 RepID=UPI003AF377EC